MVRHGAPGIPPGCSATSVMASAAVTAASLSASAATMKAVRIAEVPGPLAGALLRALFRSRKLEQRRIHRTLSHRPQEGLQRCPDFSLSQLPGHICRYPSPWQHHEVGSPNPWLQALAHHQVVADPQCNSVVQLPTGHQLSERVCWAGMIQVDRKFTVCNSSSASLSLVLCLS